MTPSTPLTMRMALRQIWEAARYPIRGNEDWAIAARLDAEALARATTAVPEPGDPPEFTQWLAALRDPGLSNDGREEILFALGTFFRR